MTRSDPHSPRSFLTRKRAGASGCGSHTALLGLTLVAIGARGQAQPRPRRCGPPVERVVSAALERAGLERQQERSWRTRLGWSALLPRFSGRLGESRYAGEVLDSRSALEAQSLNSYLAFRWEIRATWDLAHLVFDPRELRVAARVGQNAARRQQLLEHVVRLYFERCHLLLTKGMPTDGPDQASRQDLEVQRLTALLDGLTGGLFSGASWP
jgi:hypothetical protein